jgi:protein required for attachment to host cells
MSIWVLAADNSRARFFSTEKSRSPLQETRDLVDPQARLHDGDLVTDRDGRDRNPGAQYHGIGNDRSARDDGADRFAQQVCAELDAARARGELTKLYIVAAPAFLGLLRKHQSAPLRQLIAGEVAKNMAAQPAESIRAQLPDFL